MSAPLLCPRLYFHYCCVQDLCFCLYCILDAAISWASPVHNHQLCLSLKSFPWNWLWNPKFILIITLFRVWSIRRVSVCMWTIQYIQCLVGRFGIQVLPHSLLYSCYPIHRRLADIFVSASASQISFLGANCTSLLRLRQSHQLCSGHHQSAQKAPCFFIVSNSGSKLSTKEGVKMLMTKWLLVQIADCYCYYYYCY